MVGSDLRLMDWVTPLRREVVDARGERDPAWRLEVRDLARGVAGALFVSLPMLFTAEMWEVARTMPAIVLVMLVGVSLIINRLFLLFAGYRHRDWVKGSDWWDVIVTMGIGALVSAVTLYVTGIVDFAMNPLVALRTTALEMVPTSMGAAVAINQLGAGDSGKHSRVLRKSTDLTVVLGVLLGGILFAFNIAPTVEAKVVASSQNWWMVTATFLLSIAVSYIVVHIAQFEERDLSERKIIDQPWLEAAVAYGLSFVLSVLMIWLFGYGSPIEPIAAWLPQAIALAYATTIGGAAGRLVL